MYLNIDNIGGEVMSKYLNRMINYFKGIKRNYENATIILVIIFALSLIFNIPGLQFISLILLLVFSFASIPEIMNESISDNSDTNDKHDDIQNK